MTSIPLPTPRTALITGAARRIGRAIALALAGEGYAVALHANASEADARELADSITENGGKACVVVGDLGSAATANSLIADAVAGIGPLGVLVNNASLFEPDEIGTLEPGLWDRHFNVNLRAPVLLAQAFAAQLPEGHQGVVVNMIDQRVWKLTPQFMSYTLSKSALLTATTTLAQALAPRIRVVGVGPGPTLPNSRQSEEDFQLQNEALPLHYGPDTSAITRTVLFLIANQAITGQMIAVDGGQHIIWQTQDVVNIRE